MRIALVDDEAIYLDKMTQLCQEFARKQHCQLETVSFDSGEAFLRALSQEHALSQAPSLKQEPFSIVFMDIYMNEIDGISAALQMRKQDNNCLLIFLTSSADFMPDAFSCHAFEYIVKPFSSERIMTVLQDALRVLPPVDKYIEIISDRKKALIFLRDITSVVTDAHYLEISLINGTVLRSRMTMPEFLRLIENNPGFILINKGITLNADHILSFEGNSCLLETGVKFPVRVRDRQQIERAVQSYHFEKIRSRQRSWLNS